jgi:hypothetical protein
MLCRANKILLYLILALYPALVRPSSAEEEREKTAEQEALCNCAVYRAKRDAVPVYNEADTASGTKAKLKLGERVCYIGEQLGFAVVDWSKQDLLNERTKRIPREDEQQLAFVKLSDLWRPRSGEAESRSQDSFDLVEKARLYLYYMRNGILTEDVLAPFRPFIYPFVSAPECQAGKICERVEEDLKQKENEEAR